MITSYTDQLYKQRFSSKRDRLVPNVELHHTQWSTLRMILSILVFRDIFQVKQQISNADCIFNTKMSPQCTIQKIGNEYKMSRSDKKSLWQRMHFQVVTHTIFCVYQVCKKILDTSVYYLQVKQFNILPFQEFCNILHEVCTVYLLRLKMECCNTCIERSLSSQVYLDRDKRLFLRDSVFLYFISFTGDSPLFFWKFVRF